ncbi:outer membrane beta-barrel protein, partial [Halalkalibacter lacteus]|uniref:outer membrane beta-barrel protein n=1 Tax=Halalkalibacter lacteus TaxID=3090663 RepID=UPI002FCC73C1
GNLNWKNTFDTAGKEVTTDFDYVRYSTVSDMTLATDCYNSANDYNGNMLLRGHLPSDINIYTFKSDYVHPFKGGKIEAGIKN